MGGDGIHDELSLCGLLDGSNGLKYSKANLSDSPSHVRLDLLTVDCTIRERHHVGERGSNITRNDVVISQFAEQYSK